MISRSFIVAIVIIASVHALPAPNAIARESKPFVAAKRIVTEMLQEGADPAGCGEAANTTRDEVINNVQTKQLMLDSLDKGCSCAELGQDVVTFQFNNMNAASAAVTVAETSLHTATHAQVTLSTQAFHLLSGNECGWTIVDAAYESAETTYTQAVTTLNTARTTYTFSVQMHTEAVEEAARLKLECECSVQNNHAQEWASANEENAVNQRAWEQAHQMNCVLEQIYYADCVIGPVPSLTQPALCDDIESVSCAAPTGSAGPVVVTYHPDSGAAPTVVGADPVTSAVSYPTYPGAYGFGSGSGATPTVVVSDTGCHDTPNWHDADGANYDCVFYALDNNCATYGNQYAGVAGQTANQACCVCSGAAAAPVYVPTPDPIPVLTPSSGSGSGSGYYGR